MAFGLPIITTNVGGLQYFFKEGKMGYTSTPKDIDELSEKLEQLLLDHQKLSEMGKFNFEYAGKYLTSDIVSKRIYNYL